MAAVTRHTIPDKARPTSVTRRLNAPRDLLPSPPSSGQERGVVTVKKKIVVSREQYIIVG